jgi:hypothetical protein
LSLTIPQCPAICRCSAKDLRRLLRIASSSPTDPRGVIACEATNHGQPGDLRRPPQRVPIGTIALSPALRSEERPSKCMRSVISLWGTPHFRFEREWLQKREINI